MKRPKVMAIEVAKLQQLIHDLMMRLGALAMQYGATLEEVEAVLREIADEDRE